MNANTDILDRNVDRAAMLRLHERKLLNEVDEVTGAHLSRVSGIIVGGRHVKEMLDEEAKVFALDGLRTTKKSLLALAKDQISFSFQSLDSVLGSIWRTQRPRIVAEELVLDRPIFNEKTLAQVWGDLSQYDRQRISQVIRQGMATGLTEQQIALEVRRLAKLGRAQSQAITITAMTSVVAQADREVYRANKQALRGWQYVAVLDSKTTHICAARDGKIYDLEDTDMLPPAHYRCRSKTTPVPKAWADFASMENVAEVRRRNLEKLSAADRAYYDGLTPQRESYSDWLFRQPLAIQRKHLGSDARVSLFNKGALPLEGFTDEQGRAINIRELRAMSQSGYTADGDTLKFAAAKQRLDELHIPVATPDDFTPEIRKNLVEYYMLQAGELEGILSTTNYRGIQVHVKKANKRRVLDSPPRDDQVVFNPATGRYEDSRMYQPAPRIHENALRLMEGLKQKDIDFIKAVDADLDGRMSINQRAVVVNNLRTLFTRYREKPEAWGNFKAVSNAQMKFDVMNFSDAMETQLRANTNVVRKLKEANYIDPVLGGTQLQELHDTFRDNIIAKNKWEDRVAPKIASELRTVFDRQIAVSNPVIWARLNDRKLQQFYLRMANRLALADSPDLDGLATQLGRDLYTQANINGDRYRWHELGRKILDAPGAKKFYELETFGVQKRRMRSRMSGNYFGPYVDTQAWNIRITDKRIQKYARLSRSVDLGLRLGVTTEENRLYVREGYKTYFMRTPLGQYDTRIPITSTSSFGDFPVEFVDKDMADALNWAGGAKYRVDHDYHEFARKLLFFEDDKGKAKHYNEINEYRKFIASRGDSYERFKSMEWLKDRAFSNHPFIDHRARIYDRGMISPQSGETFRPFLNTEREYNFSKEAYLNLQDQIGSFVGGLSDTLEGRHNSLTVVGRQAIAERWRPEMVKLGNHMLRGKPGDIRAILDHPMVQEIDGEDIGKFYRFAMEQAKLDNFLGGDYRKLERLSGYKTALALEQDASSSGAQIIALTTRNKQLAELSNVIPTDQKKRLYDEIAARTFDDPRFKKLNEKLGLTEKDLRKAAKA